MVDDAFQRLDETAVLEDKVQDVLLDAFIMADGVHVDCIKDHRKDQDPMYNMGVEEPIRESNTKDIVEDQGFNSHILEQVIRPLYRSARCTQLVANILFMNLYTVHKVTNGFSNEIFTILNAHLLPN